jgi:fido (protein-threonine AMPylation protein)
MNLTSEQISEINSKCPEEQGIFSEPFGIPSSIKEPVVYVRWEIGGMCGGGYHENSYRHPYQTYSTRPSLVVIDLIIKELGLELTYSQFQEIEKLVQDNESVSDDSDYYGNYSDWNINYILLSDLLSLLETF